MALSLCLGSRRMYLFLLLLCIFTCTYLITSPVQANSGTNLESQKQPPDDKDLWTNNDDTSSVDKTSHKNPNGNGDKTTDDISTNPNLGRDDHTIDKTRTTNENPAYAESHDSQQPIKNDQSNQKESQLPNVKAQETNGITQGEMSEENTLQDVKKTEGGTDKEIKEMTKNKESMTDQPTSQDNSTLKTTFEHSDNTEGISETNRQTEELTNKQQPKAPSQKNDLEYKAPGIDSQTKENTELPHVDKAGEHAKESLHSHDVPDVKDKREMVNIDIRTLEVNSKAAEPTLDSKSPDLAQDDSEPSRTEEKDPGDSSVLPTQEDLPNKEVTSEKEPSSKPVEGASVGGDQASQESAVDVQDIAKEGAKDTTEEDSEEKDKEEIVSGDVDASQKKLEEDRKEEKGAEDGTKEQDDGKKPDATQKDDEDIPSFDEWKQKMLEQHQQERENDQAGQGSVAQPTRPFSLTENSKNHASSDCGAKILNVNKESQNAPAILQSNRDVYTLNPCSASIWFIVELCEPIQVKHLEIANYELFSSVPKSFRVSISDRFPSREWRQLATFHARDERSLQSFPVHEEQMFAKYLKVEMLTFFGNEHYCPLSTLRVFGTSMVEEIDEENIPQEQMEEPEVLPAHPTPVPEDGDKSLLQSAKGLVRNIMNVITGNGKGGEATPCDKKNKSCTEVEEMMPCMPEEQPKRVELENLNHSATEKPQVSECKTENTSGFSVDPLQFHKECQGSTWCFSPNYGEKFQDCCVREVSEFLSTKQTLLCCKDVPRVSLYRSVETLKTCKWPRPLRLSRDRKRDREKWKQIVKETKTQEKKTNASEKSETKDVKSMDGILSDGRPLEGASSAAPVVSSDKSLTPSSKPVMDKQSEIHVKPTVAVFTHEATKSKHSQHLPSPTPSLKSTCDMKTQEPPRIPPISIHPTTQQAVKKVSPDVKSEQSLVEAQINDEEPSVEKVKKDKPIVDIPKGEIPSPVGKIGERGALGGTETLDKTSVKDASAKELKTSASKTETASKDSPSAADPEKPDPAKPDPAVIQDKSRKADATEKDVAEMQDLLETKKALQDDKEAKESSRVEMPAKSPETVKVETAGKGNKPVPDIISNGIGSAVQKESVFMRLNNRIKALELNMSLSSRYLEELSQRYRKRMDEMQKTFNKTIKTLTENAQKAEEKDQRQQEYITRLEGQMSEVMFSLEATSQRLDHLHKEVIERHFFLMFVEIMLMSVLFLICIRRLRKGRRISSHSPAVVAKNCDVNVRRNSVPATPPRREQNGTVIRNGKRTISGGSCDDLLIIGPSTPFLESLKQANEPARHKPKNKPKHKPPIKSMSNSTILNNHQSTANSAPNHHSAPKRQSKMTAAGVLFRGPASNGRRTPPTSPTDPLHRTVSAEELPSRVQDVKGGAPPIRQQHPKPSGKHAAKKHGIIMNGHGRR